MREFPEYRTELRELFNLLSTRNDGDAMAELVSKDDKFKSISRDTAELMRDFANVKLPNKDKEGNYNMCKAVIDLTNKGRAEGIKEGKIEGQTEALAFSIKSIMQSFNQSFEQACAVLNIDAKDMERYRKMI